MKTNRVTKTAPQRIWLQVSEDANDTRKDFPTQLHDELTWCAEPVLSCEVEYVRVDLAGAAHGEQCESDPFAKDVCEGMYADKCDDVNGLCEALRAVYALVGEDAQVGKIVEEAIAEHGGG